MATDAQDLAFSNITRIAGQGEDYAADVLRRSGVNGLVVVPFRSASSIAFGAVTVTSSTPVLVSASGTGNLANRTEIRLVNAGTMPVYIGTSTSVTRFTGFLLKDTGVLLELPIGPLITLYAITASSSTTIRVIEIGT